MAELPDLPPAEGDQDRKAVLLTVVISMTILSTATVLLRIYTRTKVIHNLGWDDYTIVAAQVIRLHPKSISITYVTADYKPTRHDFNHQNG